VRSHHSWTGPLHGLVPFCAFGGLKDIFGGFDMNLPQSECPAACAGTTVHKYRKFCFGIVPITAEAYTACCRVCYWSDQHDAVAMEHLKPGV
jgi:hypothetical protein